MRAAWWWIDRWRKSTAYTDMSAEAQGIYRNLLDELWLRDGVIPKDERILAKIGGDHDAWPRVRLTVLARFYEVENGYRNETHDKIMVESEKRADKQRRYRERKRNVIGNVTRNTGGNIDGNVPSSPSPSPSPSPNGVSHPSDALSDPGRNGPYSDCFLTFWKAYPSKIGKRVAFASWKRHKCRPLLETILAAVEAQKRTQKWREGIIPNPSTWLNQGRWEDEVENPDGWDAWMEKPDDET